MAKEEPNELLQAQTTVWNLTYSFIGSLSIKCAIQLGIPDIIHNNGQRITLSELASSIPITPTKTAFLQGFIRLLVHSGTLSELASSIPITPTKTAFLQGFIRLLVHSGIFAIQKNENDKVEKEQGYVLTPSSRIFLSKKIGLSPLLLMATDPVEVSPWHFLSTWFVGDEPTASETMHGTSIWGYTASHPEFNNLFNEAMASDTRFVMSVIANKFAPVFQGLQSLVDVSGGTGTTARGGLKYRHVSAVAPIKP